MPNNDDIDRKDDHEDEMPASEAAKKYDINYNTLLSWMKKGEVEEGGNSGRPKTIKRSSLEAYLEKRGRLTSSFPQKGQPTPGDSKVSPDVPSMPSLRDHHVPVVTPMADPVEERPSAAAAPPPRRSRSPQVRKHADHKPNRNLKQKQWPTYPMEITMRQIKGAISRMSLDGQNHLRKWLNSRIDKELNS